MSPHLTPSPGHVLHIGGADMNRPTYRYRGFTIMPNGPDAYAYRAHRADMWMHADDAQEAIDAIDAAPAALLRADAGQSAEEYFRDFDSITQDLEGF